MRLFYAKNIKINSIIKLSKLETKHCIKVLRLKKGQYIHITDGLGNIFKGIINNEDINGIILYITEHISNIQNSYNLHIGISITNNKSRFKWFLEKATEIGITQITPIICYNSYKINFDKSQYDNTIIAAVKQSNNVIKPLINKIIQYHEFIDYAYYYQFKKKHLNCIAQNNIFDSQYISNIYKKGYSIIIVIGPEGGFTKKEYNYAIEKKFIAIKINSNILRTETAGIATALEVLINNR